MISGIMAGILWGLDTVVLGILLTTTGFVSSSQAIALAPFISTFLHDACSSLWMLLYMAARRQLGKVVKAAKTKSGKFIILGALLGGPLGMSGYVFSISLIGPAYSAVISSMFPAVGALLSYLFLKEKMTLVQLSGLGVSIFGVIMLGYTPSSSVIGEGFLLGIGCAFLSVIGWAGEAVICAYGMRDPDVSDEQALQIRQVTSTLFYAIVLLPLLSGWSTTVVAASSVQSYPVIFAALLGTASYVLYYRSINQIGASKAMALNITYTAWAILFAVILLGTMPDLRTIFFGLLVVLGSLVAANGISMFLPQKTVI